MRARMRACAHVRAQSDVFRKIAASEDAKGKDNNARELNEVEFLRFLTSQDRTMTRDQMRKTFASIDFDKSKGEATFWVVSMPFR